MKKRYRSYNGARIAMVCILALFCANLIFGGKEPGQKKDREMARHFFLKGAVKDANGEGDAAYEYYKKAYGADPGYVDAAFAFGSARLLLAHDTLESHEEKMQALAMMKSMIDAYPADRHTSLPYAYIAVMLDTIEEAIRVYETLEKYLPNESMIPAYKATAYATIGKSDSAVNAIRRYERIEGVSFESTLQKVRFHLMDNDTVAAISELTTLVDANPTHPEYVALKAKVFGFLEMPDSAFHYFKMAEKLDPEDGVVKSELAELYAERGDSVAYDSLTYEALLSDNLAFEAKMGILARYLQKSIDKKGDTKRSDLLFEKIREQYPHEPGILELGARYAAAKKDYNSAIEQIKYARDLDIQNPQYLGPLLSYLLMADRPADAVKEYEQAITDGMEPEIATSLVFVTAAEESNQYPKAVNVLDSLLKNIQPALSITDSLENLNDVKDLDFYSLFMVSNLYEIAGDLYYRLDSLPQAFRSYENALKVFPDHDLALNNYAYFLIEKGKAQPGSPEFEKALEMSKRSIELTEDHPNSTYLDTYAWILFREKKYEEAEEYQRKAIEAAEKDHSESAELFSHFGDILFLNNKPDEAIEQWEKALELDPNDKILKKKIHQKTYFVDN